MKMATGFINVLVNIKLPASETKGIQEHLNYFSQTFLPGFVYSDRIKNELKHTELFVKKVFFCICHECISTDHLIPFCNSFDVHLLHNVYWQRTVLTAQIQECEV